MDQWDESPLMNQAHGFAADDCLVRFGGSMSHHVVGPAKERSQERNVRLRSKPLEYLIDTERRLVIVKFGTLLSRRDIERYAMLLKADPKFRPEFSEIVDLADVRQLDLEGDDFMRLADHVDPFAPEARRAFVARTSVQQHAARMHKILRSNRNFEIFSSVAAAERWVES
jgi:hypothetical protein